LKPHTARFLPIALTLVVGYFAGCTSAPTDLDAFPNPTAECAEDTECPSSKPVCDELVGCVECQYNDQCDSAERCHQRACVPAPACSTSTECPTEQPACDVARGFCVECAANVDCGEDARCVDQVCEPATACVNSRDCEEGQVCDLSTGFCVECAGDADCPEEHACVDNACQPKCASDKDCVADGLLCDQTRAHCVECLRDVDCPDDNSCFSGKCEPDVCRAGSAVCSEGGAAVHGCNDNGSGVVVQTCPFGTTCAEGDDSTASCRNWICYPDTSECDATGRLLACSADGLSTSGIDCAAAGGACVDGACADVVCTPGEYSCLNGTSMLCNSTGTQLQFSVTCPIDTFCSETSGLCAADTCVAGQAVCAESFATVCKADGSGYEEGTDCAVNEELCWEGACLPELCTETTHCYEGDVYTCTSGGTARSLTDDCSSQEYCSEGATPQCLPKSCTPDAPTCQGFMAGTCNSQGTGLESGSVNCSASDQACYQGECLDIVCEGSTVCDAEGNVRSCTQGGTALGAVQDYCYDFYQHCAVTGSGSSKYAYCTYDTCYAGDIGCISVGTGTGVGTCNAEGSGYDVVEACGEDEMCVGTTCLPVICEQSTYYCLSGNVYLCGYDGTTNQLVDTCSASEYCFPGASYCWGDVCTAGEPLCTGANVTTCAADGSGPADAGTPCPGGETCQAGVCEPVICAANSYRCLDNVGQACNSFGTAWATSLTCGTAQYCDETPLPSAPVCGADLCEAGLPACQGETLAICGPYGGSYTDPGTDCSLTGQLCTETACAAFEELTFADGAGVTATSTSRVYFNRFHVANERQLTEIEQYFASTGTNQYTFYVYRSATATGSFNQVFTKLVTATPGAAGDFVSSGIIDVVLEAGYYYAIGVRTTGSYSYYSMSMADTFESFARFDGGFQSTGTPGTTFTVSETTTVYRQRLMLEPSP
jgi:hypothetical protein